MPSALRILCVGAFVIMCLGHVVLADEAVPAKVVSVTADHSTVLEQLTGNKKWSLSGADILKSAGRYLEEGDLVTVTGEPPAAGASVAVRVTSVTLWSRGGAIAASALILLLAAAYASKWQPSCFLVGADQRVSNSQCQVVLWFGAAMSAYLATLFLRFIESGGELIGGIAIPANVLAMTGLSGLTFAGSKMIAVSKNNGNPPIAAPAEAAEVVAVGTQKQKAATPNWRKDLFTNDQGMLDFGDFQMILIVCISVAIYITSVYLTLGNIPLQEHVTLPDVDGSLLAAFGVGQGAYLAKKAALPVGTG